MEQFDVLIIGAGPAGLSAAVYAVRAGYKVAVIEKSAMSGGQIINTEEVDNYLGLPGINGFDLGMRFREHCDQMQVQFIEDEVKELILSGEDKVVRTTKAEYHAKAVLVATGASHALLSIPGEKEFAGRGVSYCATCDGAFFRGRTVMVVGGGDVAVSDAIYLAKLCKKVYLVHRRDSLRAAKKLQDKLFQFDNVEVVWNHTVEEILGDQVVTGVKIKNTIDASEKQLEIDGIFVAVGMNPNTDLVTGLVELDKRGYIVAGEDCCTSVQGVYAAGDVRTKGLRQIVTAVADGANAIDSIAQTVDR